VRGYKATWRRPDKSVIFVRENARAIRGADGKVLYYEGTVEDISEQKKAEEKIQSYQKQLRSLASELSLAEERERRRIATILHDHIGQTLAISKIKLGALLESLSASEHIENMREVREYIEQAIKHTRSLTFELSPPILYDLGLESALEWLAEQAQEQHGIQFEFENDGQSKLVNDEIRIFLFTAVRELLVNVAKHAQAKRVKVTVRRIDENLSIHVADDGIGFNASKKNFYLDENKGFGLFSIRERLHHLGGQMEVRSQRGRGTRVILLAPLKAEKKHEEKLT
jgi:signal transduction histidine kinase